MFNHNNFGIWGEKIATKYLKKNKLRILTTNYESAHGEIDIICLQTKRAAKCQIKKLKKTLNNITDPIEIENVNMLIAQKNYEKLDKCLIFVEVKTRCIESANVVRPSESVNKIKQQKYKNLSYEYCNKNKLYFPIRFDIIEIIKENDNVIINQIENAF